MPEISIPKQLSGPEALDSMLFETRKALRRNGRFDPHMAYAGYRAEITVKFFPAASFIPPVEQTVEVSQLSAGNIVSQTATVEETIEVPVRPPNQVRVESDMPTPVLTQDQNGNPIEKWVRRDNKPPKNTVKGNGPAQTMVPTSIPPVKADADRERLAFPTREK
jgi:hypothetical protein